MDIYPTQTKHCKKCNTTKTTTDFSKDKYQKDGFKSQCRNCESTRKKLNYKPVSKKTITDYKHCKKCDTIRPIVEFFNDVSKPNGISYTCKQCRMAYRKNRLSTDPLFKLTDSIRSLIRDAFTKKRYSKTTKTHEILGCSFDEFKTHIEKQFLPNMSWENRSLWHLDHILPVSLGKNKEEIIALNHYTNFQPLWAIDNLKKGNKII